MQVSYKDLLTTSLAISIVIITIISFNNLPIPIIENVRISLLIITFLGLCIHATGFNKTVWTNPMIILQSTDEILTILFSLSD